MNGFPSAAQTISERLCDRFQPAASILPADWFAENIILIDGPDRGRPWTPDGAPYLVEIANCLTEDHPSNCVTVRKSQQTGASILALAWCLYVAAVEPASILYAAPGKEFVSDISGRKLGPLIKAFERKYGRQVFLPQVARSGQGSKSDEKRFGDDLFLALANANTKADLSGDTVRFGVKDELSKWEDLAGGEDPEKLFWGRFTAFRRTKTYKILEISTPEVDSGDPEGRTEGHCRIDRRFLKSDQRFWNITCPECGVLFYQTIDGLKINTQHPHLSKYECPGCGHHLSESERVVAVRAGEWIATAAGETRHPGFHIDAFISLMMSYGDIADDYLECRGELDRKDFTNLVLGLPYYFQGDAPDHKKLLDRREEGLLRRHIPARGLLLVGAADVQMRGIWFEVVAYAPNGESWLVEAKYIEGDTSKVDGAGFEGLRREALTRKFPDAFGGKRGLDALGVDSGYRAHVVYSFVRRWQRMHPETGEDVILALKGMEGWGKPALGTPSLVDIDLEGAKIKQGAKVWGVGTWPLKADVYTDLRKEGVRSGADQDPDGYCHFGMWVDEGYFKQLTSEYLEDVKIKGRRVGRRWKQRYDDNHFFDCRVYNRALAEYLGLSTMTEDEWRLIAKRRGMPIELRETDLFSLRPDVEEVFDEATSELTTPSPKLENESDLSDAPDQDFLAGHKIDW